MPDFVIIDTKKKTISTTKESNQSRSTSFTSGEKVNGLIYLQGIEGGRAFSFIIDVECGRKTVAVSRDGLSVKVLGAGTDTDLQGRVAIGSFSTGVATLLGGHYETFSVSLFVCVVIICDAVCSPAPLNQENNNDSRDR